MISKINIFEIKKTF